VAEISEFGRVAQGVRIIALEDGERVCAVAKIMESDDPSHHGASAGGGAGNGATASANGGGSGGDNDAEDRDA
jgi:hypothetical protein